MYLIHQIFFNNQYLLTLNKNNFVLNIKFINFLNFQNYDKSNFYDSRNGNGNG